MTDSIYAWSLTAADNDDADATVNWLENQDPDTVNNSARAMMARVAEFVKDVTIPATSSGAANAYEITPSSSATPAAYPDGYMVAVLPHQTNTGAATLKVGSLSAKALRITSATSLSAGDIVLNKPFIARYRSASDEFLMDAANVSGALTGWQLTAQLDVNGYALGDGTNELLDFVEDASAVNHIEIENEATGSGPIIRSAGDDTNVDINVDAKGSGAVNLTSATVTVEQDIQHAGDADNLIQFGTDTQDYQTGGSSRLDISDSGVRLGGANARVTTVLDEDAMGSDSATALATQQSIKAYVDTTVAAGGGGAWEYIGTVTASSDASVAFTDLSSSYFAYQVVIENLAPATDNVTLYIRTSTDNGSSYDSSAGNYAYAQMFTTDVSGSAGVVNSNSATQILCGANGGVGNATNESSSGHVNIYNPSSTAYTILTWHLATHDYQADTSVIVGQGRRLSAADVDAIQFLFSSGNISTGTFKLYGLTAS